MQLPLVTALGESRQWNQTAEESCVLAEYRWDFRQSIATLWDYSICRGTNELLADTYEFACLADFPSSGNFSELNSTLHDSCGRAVICLHDPAYVATTNWSKSDQSESSLGILHTRTKKENQCVGMEDLKCKTWELSAGHIFYLTKEGSLQRENQANTQRQRTNSKIIWIPGYRPSWAYLCHCSPYILLLSPFLDYVQQ